MKSAKNVGIVFVVCGILFAIIGTVAGIVRLMEKDDCKYATAYIVKIDEKKQEIQNFLLNTQHMLSLI